MGAALEARLGEAGHEVPPAAGRGSDGVAPDGAVPDVVLLAVPDAAIAEAAALVARGPIVGHLSGATPLDALRGHDDAFSLHPLLPVTGAETSFAGAFAALDASSDRGFAAALSLADALGLEVLRVADEDRAAYHAAASVAANFLVVLEDLAERLAATAGLPRRALMPLAEASLRNWGELGAPEALTGPVARGDEETVARQRAAVAERLPERLTLFDALVDAARELRVEPVETSGASGPGASANSASGASGPGSTPEHTEESTT